MTQMTIESDIWSCPCCGISEPDLVEQAKKHCKPNFKITHIHHDHLGDFAAKFLKNEMPEVSIKNLDLGRFPATKVCSFCNTEESKLKRTYPLALYLHPHFSFSPDEMREFLSRNENNYLEFDEKKATEVYDAFFDEDGLWKYSVQVINTVLPFNSLMHRTTSDQIYFARILHSSLESCFPEKYWDSRFAGTLHTIKYPKWPYKFAAKAFVQDKFYF